MGVAACSDVKFACVKGYFYDLIQSLSSGFFCNGFMSITYLLSARCAETK